MEQTIHSFSLEPSWEAQATQKSRPNLKSETNISKTVVTLGIQVTEISNGKHLYKYYSLLSLKRKLAFY
jgi:hypothetical protein